MELFDNYDIDEYIIKILINNLIVLGIFIVSILWMNKKFIEKDDNIKAIYISSLILALSILLTGINSSRILDNLTIESLYTSIYLLSSLIIIFISKIIFQKIFLRYLYNYSRMALSIINSSIIFSMAWIIRSLTIWLDIISHEGIIIIFILYFISEIILTLASFAYFRIHQDSSKYTIESAISYFGFRISIGFILSGVTAFVPYDIIDLENTLTNWLVFSVVANFIFILFTIIIKFLLRYFLKTDHNISSSIVETSIYIATSLIVTSLIW